MNGDSNDFLGVYEWWFQNGFLQYVLEIKLFCNNSVFLIFQAKIRSACMDLEYDQIFFIYSIDWHSCSFKIYFHDYVSNKNVIFRWIIFYNNKLLNKNMNTEWFLYEKHFLTHWVLRFWHIYGRNKRWLKKYFALYYCIAFVYFFTYEKEKKRCMLNCWHF